MDQNPCEDKTGKNHKTRQEGITPMVATGSDRQEVDTESIKSQGKKKKAKWPQVMQAICTGIIVIITAWYTHYAGVQATKMEEATAAARKSADAAESAAATAKSALESSGNTSRNILNEMAKQSKSMQDAVSASRLQTEIIKKAAEQSDRAYIYVKPGNLYCVSDNTTCPLENYIFVGNSGRTNANGVERYIEMTVKPPLTPNQEASLGTGGRKEGIMVMGPGVESAIMQRTKTLNREGTDQNSIIDGKKRIYVFGEIRYRDVFGHFHKLEFCHSYWGSYGMINFTKNGGMGYEPTYVYYCEKHNNEN
jgi:hypothetical protein